VRWGQKRSSALTHILDAMLLETSFPAHTHIFPTTLETFSLALTHLKDRMSYGVLIGPSNLSVFLVTSMTYYDILE